jgi:serine/threonine protein kinase/tetratricopeptide (TPR) repeat protein
MADTTPGFAGLSELIYIGEGGSGCVYRSRHSRYGTVAVKIARDQSPQKCKQLQHEYRVLRGLRHDGICRIHDFGWTDDRRPFVIMPLLDGGNLYRYTSRIPLDRRFECLAVFFDAVAYLHNLGIIHRDLKGDNILMDHTGNPVITDLGLAASAGSISGRSGTLEYMAPEIIEGSVPTVQSDVYSIGVILYKLAGGRSPFGESEQLQLISRKRSPDEIDFQMLEGVADGRLVDLISRSLSAEPEDRPRSVEDVASSLESARLISGGKINVHIAALMHHHLYSYTTSFAMQELRSPTDRIVVNSHFQADAAELKEVVGDHLKLSGWIPQDCRSNELSMRRVESDSQVSIALNDLEGEVTADRVIEFPELDRQAFVVTLRKLFSAGIEDEDIDELFHLTGGNLKLLQILLVELERRHVDFVASGLKLSLPKIVPFSPPLEYYRAIEKIAPAVPNSARSTLELLSADRFDNDRTWLIECGAIAAAELSELVQARILHAESFQFVRSYFQRFYFQQLPPARRRSIGSTWAKLLETEAPDTLPRRSEQLMHHLIIAGDTEAAARAALSLSDQLRQENKLEAARRTALRARSIENLEQFEELHLQVLMRGADLEKDAGLFDRAMSDYALIVRQARRRNNRPMLAEAYKDLGDVYKARADYQRGLRVLNRAMRLYEEIGDELELSHCHNNVGNIYWINGELEAAEAEYRTALDIQRRLGVLRDVSSTLSNLASVKCLQQKFTEGVPLYQEAIRVAREIEDIGQQARSANNLSVAYIWTDQLTLARRQLDESLNLNLALGAKKEIVYNHENIGEVELSLGNYREALESLLKGLKMAPLKDLSHRSAFTLRLGQIFLRKGNYRKAAVLLRLARKLAVQVTDSILSMEIPFVLGEYFLTVRDFTRAGEVLSESVTAAAKLGDHKKETNALILMIQAYREAFLSSEQLEELHTRVESLLQRSPSARELLLLKLEKCETAIAGGDFATARSYLKAAAEIPAFDAYRVIEPRHKYVDGLVLSEEGKLDAAVEVLTDSVRLAEKIDDCETYWRSMAAKGKALLRLTRYEEALRSFLESFSTIRALTETITEPSIKSLYLDDPRKQAVAEALEEISSLTT